MTLTWMGLGNNERVIPHGGDKNQPPALFKCQLVPHPTPPCTERRYPQTLVSLYSHPRKNLDPLPVHLPMPVRQEVPQWEAPPRPLVQEEAPISPRTCPNDR